MAPARAKIWGFSPTAGATVTVSLDGKMVASVQSTDTTDGQTGGMWSALLPAKTAGGPHSIEVHCCNSSVSLTDVLFGDVWICSGQSNMYFTVQQVGNALTNR